MKRGKPRHGRFEVYWLHGDPQVTLRFWFRDMEDDEPAGYYLDPDTGALA